jgi:hypothetical protein
MCGVAERVDIPIQLIDVFTTRESSICPKPKITLTSGIFTPCTNGCISTRWEGKPLMRPREGPLVSGGTREGPLVSGGPREGPLVSGGSEPRN